jgi:flap endonuclease-1
MGIKNLKYLINKYANETINEKYLNFYENKIIAIDISIYLYRFIYKNGEPLELLVQQCMRLLKNKIIPLYVFDGKPPKEKNDVLDERNEKKVDLFNKQLQIKNLLERKKDLNEDNEICNNDEKINNIDDIFYNELIKMSNDELNMELQKIEKRIIIVNGTIIKKCKLLFQLMGIPYIVANGEAESLCAKLIKKNIVYGCLSEDTDILANGGRYFIRNFNVYNNKIIEYDLEKIL